MRIVDVDARVIPIATRIPFRYGIAEMTAAPHVVVQVSLQNDDGALFRGWASEHLPPKWFTKDPDSSFVSDIADMVAVIEHAVAAADELSGATVFDIWEQLSTAQEDWARAESIPGLLAGLGSALVERALIDAGCRLAGLPFATALATGVLGFDAGRIHPELIGAPPLDGSVTSIAVRHTVGLSDPLTEDEVTDRPDDDLPVSLEAVIERYGVDHFKIKTAGRLDDDIARLHRILDLLDARGIVPVVTIDGNESMKTAQHLVDWTRGLLADKRIAALVRSNLVAVEQPFHRSIALGDEAAAALAELKDDIAVIIDESDDALRTVRKAMDLGYAGGTYKGCKGVFRGLANAMLVKHRGAGAVLTAEDLSTVPPLTVAQDLVVASVMGLTHIERNGHHYFGRLAPLSPGLEDNALAAHPDLYERHADGRVRVRIEGGRIALDSILAAPFGAALELDIASLEPLSVDAATRGR